MRCAVQDFGADVLLGEMFYPCTALLANRLQLPWVNYWAIAPLEPHFTSPWASTNRRLLQPKPLSYFPQSWMRVSSQHMVGFSCTADANVTLQHEPHPLIRFPCADDAKPTIQESIAQPFCSCHVDTCMTDPYALSFNTRGCFRASVSCQTSGLCCLQTFWQRLENLYRYWEYAWEDYCVHRIPVQAQ